MSITNNPKNDTVVATPPTDSISALAFSATADFLAVSSWDSTVRIYQVSAQNGQNEGKALYNHNGPALDVCWSKDGSKVLSGGTDNAARMMDLQSGQMIQIGGHDAPVRCVRWVDMQTGILVTGSWDKTLKYWDLRTPNAVATVALPDKCYALDVREQLLVAGTAEKHILIYDLKNPTAVFKQLPSPLKMQTRTIACFPKAEGYVIGSIEGRLAVQYVDDKRSTDNYSFKCHRKDESQGRQTITNVYSVNDVAFNNLYGSLATAGADGVICYWDLKKKTRLRSWDASPAPISAVSFNKDSTLFAYAVSYDWSKGYSGMTSTVPNEIRLHRVKEEELTKNTLR